MLCLTEEEGADRPFQLWRDVSLTSHKLKQDGTVRTDTTTASSYFIQLYAPYCIANSGMTLCWSTKGARPNHPHSTAHHCNQGPKRMTGECLRPHHHTGLGSEWSRAHTVGPCTRLYHSRSSPAASHSGSAWGKVGAGCRPPNWT